MKERPRSSFSHGRESLASRKKPASRDTPAALREDLDLTQVDLAAALDVTPRTVQNWEKHGRGPERRYRDLKELHGLLSKYIGSGQVASWMDSPNEAFQNRTPRQLIRERKTRDLDFRVWTAADRRAFVKLPDGWRAALDLLCNTLRRAV